MGKALASTSEGVVDAAARSVSEGSATEVAETSAISDSVEEARGCGADDSRRL